MSTPPIRAQDITEAIKPVGLLQLGLALDLMVASKTRFDHPLNRTGALPHS